MSRGTSRSARQRGSVSVELAILTPLFLLLMATATMFGRTAIAANAIDVAAHDAARAASISRTAVAADANARAAATESLSQQGLQCIGGPQIDPDVSDFNQGGVDLGFVIVTIACDVSLTDIAIPGVPSHRLVTTTFVSPIDIFREQP